MAYDTGGNTLEAASQKNGSVLHISSQKPILDADIASDGSICYLSSESGYRSVLYVYNSQQALIYRWLSSSRYFMRCTVSSGKASYRWFRIMDTADWDTPAISAISRMVTRFPLTLSAPALHIALLNYY